MRDALQVEAARIPDRDRLLELLRGEGIDARAVDGVGIAVPCGESGAERECGELLVSVEHVVMNLGAPFVPLEHDGVIYIRPPLS